MKRRHLPRIDYRVLDSTGEVTRLNSELSPQEEQDISFQFNQLTLKSPDRMTTNIKIETNVLIQEVLDVIDENPIYKNASLDSTIQKLCDLRNTIRQNDILMKDGNQSHELTDPLGQALLDIKMYIKEANEHKHKGNLGRSKNESEAAVCKERSALFTTNEIIRNIKELEMDFSVKPDTVTDVELIQLKTELSSQNQRVRGIAQQYESILQTPVNIAEILHGIKEIGEHYEVLVNMKSAYTDLLNHNLKERDAYKQKLFSESKLNIRLEKFSGYSDVIYFYTFKSNFNKLYERTTPKHLLPELLKNNHLKDPALSMVKSLSDIDAIWSQLKFAYGDVKLMLTKKLNQLSAMEPLVRFKDVESSVNILSKLIILVKELVLLVETHKLEEHLYFGDGLQRIYCLLGDARLSRWLTSISDEDLSPKETWKKFSQFIKNR